MASCRLLNKVPAPHFAPPDSSHRSASWLSTRPRPSLQLSPTHSLFCIQKFCPSWHWKAGQLCMSPLPSARVSLPFSFTPQTKCHRPSLLPAPHRVSFLCSPYSRLALQSGCLLGRLNACLPYGTITRGGQKTPDRCHSPRHLAPIMVPVPALLTHMAVDWEASGSRERLRLQSPCYRVDVNPNKDPLARWQPLGTSVGWVLGACI